MEYSINICNIIQDDGCLDGFFDSTISGRRQDAEKYYRINGAIYIQTIEALMSKNNLYGENSFAYIMDKKNSLDIDDEIDFIMAEAVGKLVLQQ